MAKKIGRNEPCPCGSGIKYKKCHLEQGINDRTTLRNIQKVAGIKEKLLSSDSKEINRIKQQGLGRPIISANQRENKIIAVGKKAYSSKNFKTFHDFLWHYIVYTFGKDWFEAESKKVPEERHIIFQWYDIALKKIKEISNEDESIYNGTMNGAILCYYSLAYHLYLLAHNVELEKILVKRLKDPEQFQGALYESKIFSHFIKAGFSIEIENEADGSKTHHEFTAAHKRTGKRFSVEAKSHHRNGVLGFKGSTATGETGLRIGRFLSKALKKETSHERIIFIDLNLNDNSTSPPASWADNACAAMDEEKRRIKKEPGKQAYIFITNHSSHYNLNSVPPPWQVMVDSVNVNNFSFPDTKSMLENQLILRKHHPEIFDLQNSMIEHDKIPATFDGSNPEATYGNEENQLAKKEESRTPLDWFDFFYKTYRYSTKEKLLELMSGSRNIDKYKEKCQSELAEIYCLGLTESVYRNKAQRKK